ncbi:hypothetical protein [Pseudomonas fluorescens]|uniref:hypothetical protein n=1 Tax=Pseudomonas fluorescens TaxID=294 RepID=UPI001241A4FF|nr:hypothetical protein [Pseudomonas fluorescens]
MSGRRIAAMVVNDNADNLDKRGAFKSIAGKPAPTGIVCFSGFLETFFRDKWLTTTDFHLGICKKRRKNLHGFRQPSDSPKAFQGNGCALK